MRRRPKDREGLALPPPPPASGDNTSCSWPFHLNPILDCMGRRAIERWTAPHLCLNSMSEPAPLGGGW